MNQTAQWLEDYLTEHGRTRSSEVKRAAEKAGHLDTVLAKTRRSMGVLIHRNDDRTTDWELPPARPEQADPGPDPFETDRTAEDMEREQASAMEIDLDADDDDVDLGDTPTSATHRPSATRPAPDARFTCPTCGQPTDKPIAVHQTGFPELTSFERSPAAAARTGPPPCPVCGEGMLYDNRGVTPPYFCRVHGRTM